MTPEQFTALLEKLSEDIQTEMERLDEVLTAGEEKFQKFQELR